MSDIKNDPHFKIGVLTQTLKSQKKNLEKLKLEMEKQKNLFVSSWATNQILSIESTLKGAKNNFKDWE